MTSEHHTTEIKCKTITAHENVKQIEISVILSVMQRRRFQCPVFNVCLIAMHSEWEMKDLWSLGHQFIEFYTECECLGIKNEFNFIAIQVSSIKAEPLFCTVICSIVYTNGYHSVNLCASLSFLYLSFIQ